MAKIGQRDVKNSDAALFWVNMDIAAQLVHSFSELFPEATIRDICGPRPKRPRRGRVGSWDWSLAVDGGEIELLLTDTPRDDRLTITLWTDLHEPTRSVAMEYAQRLIRLGARPDPSPFRGFIPEESQEPETPKKEE